MKNPFSGLFRARDKPGRQPSPKDAVSGAPSFFFGSSGAGKSVTVQTAIQLSTVYACVRVISETIASLPLGVYQVVDEGTKKATDHPLYRLLHDEPNSEMTSFVLREVMLAHLLLYGNSYCQIIRTGRNRITGLYPLLPDKMNVDRDKNGILTYVYTTTSGVTVTLAPEDVLHIPGLGFDGIMGYSPIAIERNAIGLGIAAEEYGGKFFSNGARPSGILTHPNTVKNPKALRESWNAAYGGSSNAGRVCVLEEGMRFESIAMPNNEAQFLETRKFQVDEICRIFRVPPHLVGNLEHATFSNIEHQSIDFAVHTIRPWLVRIEQSMNRALFTDREKGVYEKMEADVIALGKEIERLERQAAIDRELDQPTAAPLVSRPTAATDRKQGRASDEYRNAFWGMIRNRAATPNVMNALQIGTDSEGGYLVPDEYERTLVQALEEENVLRSLCTIIQTSSGDRKIPVVASHGTASWVDEEGTIPESDDVFGQITIGAHKVATMIKVSDELLQDSVFNIESYIAAEFARRIGAAEEDAFINGDGTGKPTGLLHATNGAGTGVTTTGTTIAADEIIDLVHSIKSVYRKKATFLMNDSTIKAIRKLKDGNGQYLWQPGLKEGQPDMLLNYRIVTSPYMPEVAAGNKVILFGDFKSYWIADRQGRSFQRLNELFAVTGQVGFRATQRVDGRLVLAEAMKCLAVKP